MDPNWDVKKAVEEDTKRRRVEAAKKRVAKRKPAAKEQAEEAKKTKLAKKEAENAAKKKAEEAAKGKAEEAKRMKVGRKIKEENIEKNKKGVTIAEPLPTSKKSFRTDEAEQQAKKKQKLSFSTELVVIDDLSSNKVPPAQLKEAEHDRRPPSAEGQPPDRPKGLVTQPL